MPDHGFPVLIINSLRGWSLVTTSAGIHPVADFSLAACTSFQVLKIHVKI
jgi:hypothetical protein